MNTEMRTLFEEERKTMDQETNRLENMVESMHKASERKMANIRGKLFLLHSMLSCGKEIIVHREQIQIDELFEKIQELAFQVSKQVAIASLVGSGPHIHLSHEQGKRREAWSKTVENRDA